ncbi:cytochrome P450 94A2-like [Macadamia integrifolia]|uniref:cytochrome P450 94A2-like n=1 Tax=Macadamia integrifolia TaxID=60698 RepID=UPI001C4E6B85|nr:cytochrome P450 94A2-like [Macadamia integrifolia]
MVQLELLTSLLLFILLLLFLLFIKTCFTYAIKSNKSSSPPTKLPISYPLIGSNLTLVANMERSNQWIIKLLQNTTATHNGTNILDQSLGYPQLITTNPLNVQHILKTQFYIYPKGDIFRDGLSSFLGSGIFNADGEKWKFQRQISSHAFNTKSLRKFVETAVEVELHNRLLPLLSMTTTQKSVLDLQDILQRFAFDNICKSAFGFDPNYLSPSFPQPETEFAVAFEAATLLSTMRFGSIFRWIWKLKRALDIGSEKQLRIAVLFQAGPRICLGKAMAFLQMKGVVAGVMRQFRVVPAENGFEPVFVAYLTPKMKGGFPVRIEERGGE